MNTATSNKITIQSTDIWSSQEWTTDPDMIEIYVGEEDVRKFEKCIAFMQENDIHKTTIWWAFGYELFERADGLDDGDLEGKELTKGEDGQEYVQFEPEYRLDGCSAEIYRDGDINATFEFKHTGDSLWTRVGNLKDLKEKIGVNQEGKEAAQKTSVANASFTHIEIRSKAFPMDADFDANCDEAQRQIKTAEAAPKLLSALESLHKYVRDNDASYRNGLNNTDPLYSAVTDAIANAKGETR